MRPQFHPILVNDPFGDPGVYIDCLFARRALLFDLGDISRLPPKKLLRVSDVFVSHAHMDHFMGFDWLLRLLLGRAHTVRLYGPPGFIGQVEHRLAGYTWNLVESYDTDFTFQATEVSTGGRVRRACFRCKSAFKREEADETTVPDGILRDEDEFRVRGVFLDHQTPVLAFALEEKQHINVWKNRLEELGLPTGPWLNELKRAVRAQAPDDRLFPVRWRDRHGDHERLFPLGQLRHEVLRFVPGQKIAYVTDAVYHEANAARIAALARDADILFIEAPFLDEDAERARNRYHLTARQAGLLARAAGAKAVVPFHFSPMYESDGGEALRRELLQAREFG
jgi:ribonuclease Z